MDVHIFYKMFWQVVLLAVFGLAVATALSGVMAKMIFVYYHWTWFEALLFGSIVSATDPVAVVALLNDLGKSGLWLKREILRSHGFQKGRCYGPSAVTMAIAEPTQRK